MLQREIDVSAGAHILSLPAQGLPKGRYLVRIDGAGQSATALFTRL